jgi:hypothetical protein
MNTNPNVAFPDPPTFEKVLERLKLPFLDAIQEAIAEGTLHVSEYANWQAEPIDFALAPNLVRHKAKRLLISKGQDAKDEEEEDKTGFETERIPNNGLCMIVPGFRVRVLKSCDDGGIPQPGNSVTRQNFYNQRQALLDFAEFRNGNTCVQPEWGLIVHWTVDKKYSLSKLSVALPVSTTKTDSGKLVVDCAFDEPFWIRPQPAVISIEEVLSLDDLDLLIEEEPTEKSGEEPKEG